MISQYCGKNQQLGVPMMIPNMKALGLVVSDKKIFV